MNKIIFFFLIIMNNLAAADLYQSCPGNIYVYVSNKNKADLFMGSSGFKENSNEKIYVYSAEISNKLFLKSFDLILTKKNISDGTYLASDLCDCGMDFTETLFVTPEIEEMTKNNLKKCISSIKFEKIGDTQFSYFYEKMKWIALSKFN